MLDRIDFHVEVPRVEYENLSGDRVGESSEAVSQWVQAARNLQQKRFSNNGSSDTRSLEGLAPSRHRVTHSPPVSKSI